MSMLVLAREYDAGSFLTFFYIVFSCYMVLLKQNQRGYCSRKNVEAKRVYFYYALWLVGKSRVTFSTNQK